MAKKCFYDVLGVDRSSSEADLKSAYRKLAMKHHPDRNPDNPEAEQKFKECSEAYDILKDEQKRAAYDQFGHAAFDGTGGPGAGAGGFDFGSTGFADVFDDLFGDFMGGGRRQSQGRNRGNDLRYNMEITLEDAFQGKKADIRVPSTVNCDTCDGSGSAEGTQAVSCPTCHGRGRVRAQQGFFTVERTCPSCQGQGQIIKDPCKSCGGAGRVKRDRTLSVNIPQGVEEGTRIRLAGEGEAGLRGGAAGDLYIFLSIAPHELFQRDGKDLYCRVPISLVQAALGGQVEVPTVGGGRARVTIPEGTQSGRQFRLRGKGMPGLRGQGQGDLYIQAVTETPVKLSRKQKELLRQFQDESTDKNSPESAGFFSKVKDFFN